MKKLILILALMFCLIFSLNTLAFEKVDVTMVNSGLSTVYVPKIQTLLDHGLGSSTTAVPLLADDPALTVYATSSAVTGTIQSSVISLTIGASGAAVSEALHVVLSSEYITGSWANAIVAKIDYGSTGSAAYGLAASISAEMNLAPIVSPGGSYYNVHSYFNVPTNAELIDSTAFNYAFERYELSGEVTYQFDYYGLLWHIVGLYDASGKVLYENTLKIQIDETKWWIPLSLAEGMYRTTERIRIDLDPDETPALHIHTHQVEIGVEGENVANDFKGEFLRTTGIADGMRLQYTMDADSSGILRSIMSNAYLNTAITLSGGGEIYGISAGVNMLGTVSGATIRIAALQAATGQSVGATLTEAAFISVLSLTNRTGPNLVTGETQILFLEQEGNAFQIDQAIYLFGGDRITEFIHFEDVATMVTVGTTQDAAVTADASIAITIDDLGTFYIPAYGGVITLD